MADDPNLPAPLITSDPTRLGGTPSFTGTRVPVQTFFDYMEGGESLDTFVEHFPDASQAHPEAVLALSASQFLKSLARREPTRGPQLRYRMWTQSLQ